MFKLIKNELIKLIEKRGNLIGFVIVMIISGGLIFLMDTVTKSITENIIDENGNIDYVAKLSGIELPNESVWLCSDEEFKENLKNEEEDIEENVPIEEDSLKIEKNKKVEYLKVLHKYKVKKATWQGVVAYGISMANSMEISNTEAETNGKNVFSGIIESKKNELEKILEKDDYDGFLEYMIKICKATENSGDYSDEFFKENKPIKNVFKYIKDNNIKYENWYKVGLLVTMEQSIANKKDGTLDKDTEDTKEVYLMGRYKLENNIKAITSKDTTLQDSSGIAVRDNMGFWDIVVVEAPNIMMFVIIFIMVLASGIVSTEYATGTIKFLVLNPKRRRKIITSKYLSLVIVSIVSVVSFYIVAMIVGVIRGGVSDIGAKYLTIENNQVHCTTAFVYLLKLIGLGSLTMISVMTLAFALSAVAKNSAIGATIGIFIYMSEDIIIQMFDIENVGRYLLMPNLNLSAISQGQATYYNLSVTDSVLNVLIHIVLCFMIAYDSFTKKEI